MDQSGDRARRPANRIHGFGCEERLWFGPEGGPLPLFFPSTVMDTGVFDAVGKPSATEAMFAKSFEMPNRADSVFSIDVKRAIALACATADAVKNLGEIVRTPETNAPSIWLLDMFKPMPLTTIVILHPVSFYLAQRGGFGVWKICCPSAIDSDSTEE